ncbi:MAG: glycosyltransferase [Clostridia bacterium]
MKKIMFFRPMFYMGGTEIAILSLISKLDINKYEVIIGYTDETSDIKLLNRFEKYCKVIKLNTNIKVDILINCSPYTTSIDECTLVERTYTYLWFHHFGNRGDSILGNTEYLNYFDKIIVVSESTKHILETQEYYNSIKDKIEVIYNVIDIEKIIEESNIPINLELGKDLNLVTVSRLTHRKGFDRKLHLAKLLKEKNIDFKWYIIGSNYYKEIEEEIINKFNDLKENFVFLGFLENPYNIIKKCDYLALLSDDETWGLTLTEAKLLHVPCIVTNFDVAYEQINYDNGVILSRNNLNSYSSNIDYILKNKTKLKKNLKNYTYSNDETLKLWDNLLNI